MPLFLFWLCKRFLAQYSVLLIGKRSNRLFQRGLELTTKRGRGSIRRQFFLLWNYDEKKRCTKGRGAPSCISFHLNAARMRCAPIQFARVLGCRLCCGFGAPLIRAACREVVEKWCRTAPKRGSCITFPRGRWVDWDEMLGGTGGMWCMEAENRDSYITFSLKWSQSRRNEV